MQLPDWAVIDALIDERIASRKPAAYLTGDAENGAGTEIAERRLYAVGVRHDF